LPTKRPTARAFNGTNADIHSLIHLFYLCRAAWPIEEKNIQVQKTHEYKKDET